MKGHLDLPWHGAATGRTDHPCDSVVIGQSEEDRPNYADKEQKRKAKDTMKGHLNLLWHGAATGRADHPCDSVGTAAVREWQALRVAEVCSAKPTSYTNIPISRVSDQNGVSLQ